MTLGELIKEYRREHALSQGDFAKKSGFSRGYVSMLENNRNPQSGLPIALTLETMQKAALGMGLSVDDLFSIVDQKIDLSAIRTKWEQDVLDDYFATNDDKIRLEIIETYGVCPEVYSDWKRILGGTNLVRVSKPIQLSAHEQELILAYRKQPQSVKDFISQSLGLAPAVPESKNA